MVFIINSNNNNIVIMITIHPLWRLAQANEFFFKFVFPVYHVYQLYEWQSLK